MNNELKEIKDLIIDMREEFRSEIMEIKADISEMKADIKELKQEVA